MFNNPDIMSNLYNCISRLTRDPAEQDKILGELMLYTNAQGLFGNELAISSRKIIPLG